jgi:hypothetical protein
MKRTRVAAVSAAAVLFGMLGAGVASAAPPSPWLPDADLFCPVADDPLVKVGWVTPPGSDSLWVTTGPLAGHYVLLAFSHYWMDGLQYAPPASYAGLPQLNDEVRGAKTGLTGPITCHFVSRFDLPGTSDDFSVVGPATMVRVSR